MPAEAEWRALEERLGKQPAAWMLFEGEPHPEARDRLAALGMQVVVFEPGGGRTNLDDWLETMAANATRLEAAASQRRARARDRVER